MKKVSVRMMILAGGLFAFPALSCDVCATYVARPTAEGRGAGGINLFEQYSRFDPVEPGEHAFRSYTTQFGADMCLNKRWSLQVGVPYLDHSLGEESESGIGDATLVAVYRALEARSENATRILDFHAGIKAPTGDSDRLAEEEAPEHAHMAGEEEGHSDHAEGHHLALGSGSWDGIVGARSMLQAGRWQVLGDVQYTARTEGDHDFTYGDEFTWRAGALYTLVKRGGTTVALGPDLTGSWQDDNEVQGQAQPGSGSSATYLGPALAFTWKRQLHIAAAVDFAIAHANEGVEGAADERVRASASWQF